MKVIFNCKHYDFHKDYCLNIHNELIDEYVTLSGLILPMEKHCKVSIIWRDRNLKNILITLKEVSFWNMIMGEDRERIHS